MKFDCYRYLNEPTFLRIGERDEIEIAPGDYILVTPRGIKVNHHLYHCTVNIDYFLKKCKKEENHTVGSYKRLVNDWLEAKHSGTDLPVLGDTVDIYEAAIDRVNQRIMDSIRIGK